MPEMLPRRIVIGTGMHADLAQAIRTARPDLDLRHKATAGIEAEDLAWADTFVGFGRPPVATMGNVKWVHCTGAGVDAWVYPVELPREILLTRSSESFGPMIAEWVLARALAFTQHLIELCDNQRECKWAGRHPTFIRGTRAVVVGTGDVGTSVARAFRSLGADVSGISRSGRGDLDVFSRVDVMADLSTAVADVDWLILTLPLTRETHGLVGRDVLSHCRGAVLINAGRGAVVVEQDIARALDAGCLRGAALDVFDVEPLPPTSPLWSDRRVMLSPHISGQTTVEGALAGFLECLTELETGAQPRWIVDRAKGY
jgi:phosphoglycerate dehydrogenase-like enzyme